MWHLGCLQAYSPDDTAKQLCEKFRHDYLMHLMLLLLCTNAYCHACWEDVLVCPVLDTGARKSSVPLLPQLGSDGFWDLQPITRAMRWKWIQQVFHAAGYPNCTPHGAVACRVQSTLCMRHNPTWSFPYFPLALSNLPLVLFGMECCPDRVLLWSGMRHPAAVHRAACMHENGV